MANYIESSLTDGESVELISKIHWMALVMPGALTLLAALWFSSEAGQIAFWVMVSCIFWLLARVVYVYFSEVVVTNKRFVFKRGLISRNVQEIVYNKVDSTELNQDFAGRIMNYGKFKVLGTGQGTIEVHYLKTPISLRKSIQEKIS